MNSSVTQITCAPLDVDEIHAYGSISTGKWTLFPSTFSCLKEEIIPAIPIHKPKVIAAAICGALIAITCTIGIAIRCTMKQKRGTSSSLLIN